MGKDLLKEMGQDRKNGIVQKVGDYIAVKPGGKGYDPQRLDFYNSEGEKVDEEEFDQKLSSVIPTSEGFVVQSGDYPELELTYFNEKLERCNSFSSDNHLSVSPGYRKILAWDKDEGELHIFGPKETKSFDKIFSGWEKGVEINSYYDRKLNFEVSYSEEGLKIDRDNEWDLAFEPGDTRPLRGMSYLNGYIYVGYGQHLFRLEPKEDGLVYVDQLDFTDENRDENWVNYVRTIQDEVIIGRYDGEIWSIKPEMEPENRVDVKRKINYQTFSMASEDNEKVFGVDGGRENSEVAALSSSGDSWVEELSTSTDSEVFASDKFFGYSVKDTVKIYNYDFEEVFSQRYGSKVRCDLLGDILCISGNKLRFYQLR
jgi:hypothetical protein